MHKGLLLGALLFAALPATSNYRLNSYGFGSGGTNNSSTATYSLQGISGELNGGTASTANNSVKSGYIQTEQANVPKVLSIDNGSGLFYNKLHFVIDSQGNPSDAKYLVAVSTDNFVSNTLYLQTDGTLSSTLSPLDYQTYTNWGGSSGTQIIGLLPSTTYYVRLRATQGAHTESAYGPSAKQPTADPSITFSLSTSSSPSPPYSVSLGMLNAGSINSASGTINTSFTTNGASGGDVYITSKNGGLLSSSTGYKINAVTNDLTGLPEGFGAQNTSVTKSSGSAYNVQSPYAGSGNNVGIVSNVTRSLYSASGPVSGGSGVLNLKAKAAATDTAASDYQEVLTFTASANF